MSFDCRGFDEMIQFPYKNENHEMLLIASGIRSQRVVFVNLDIFLCGIYITSEFDNQVKENTTKNYYEKLFQIAKGDETKDLTFLLKIKFLKGPPTHIFVEKITEALSSAPLKASKEAVDKMKQVLLKAIGSNGIKRDDILDYVFTGENKLEILINGNSGGIIDDYMLRRELLRAHLGLKGMHQDARDVLMKRYDASEASDIL